MSTTREDDRTDAVPVDGEVTFPTVVRGYERHQVDRFVAHQRRLVRELRTALTATEDRLQRATEQGESDAAERERLRAELDARNVAVPEGFGTRAEKLLRMAESEAAQMRAGASRESVALVEQARVAAEQHRHDAEQAAIARSRELEQEIRRRTAELVDRERKAAEQVAAGRDEAERLRTAAEEAASTLRAETEAEAELIKARARAEAGRTREEARVEQNRVTELRAEVHAELDRLSRMILDQLAGSTPAPPVHGR